MKKNQMDLNTYSDMVFALNAINMMLPEAIRKDYLPYIDRIKNGLLSVDVYNPDDEETLLNRGDKKGNQIRS